MDREIKPTRMELMEVRRKIALSERGYHILKMKRDGLIVEFFNVLSKARNIREKIIDDYKKASHHLTTARCLDGDAAVLSASFNAGEDPVVRFESKNVMGVVVPTSIESGTVRRRIDRRGYGIIGISPYIDASAAAYEELVEGIILAAELETTLKRLIEEIERTKRRVNALEFKVIPELRQIEYLIRLRLEEMERDNVFRLKRIKQKAG